MISNEIDDGYLISEKYFSSSSSSSESSNSDSNINCPDNIKTTSKRFKNTVKRSYDIASNITPDPSVTSSSYDTQSSSGTEAVNNYDCKQKQKSKLYSKKFVANYKINKMSSSSSGTDSESTDVESEEFSDNDTVTNSNISIILNYIKPIDDIYSNSNESTTLTVAEKVKELTNISADVYKILQIPETETEHLVKKLKKDVEAINHDHIIMQNRSTEINYITKPDLDKNNSTALDFVTHYDGDDDKNICKEKSVNTNNNRITYSASGNKNGQKYNNSTDTDGFKYIDDENTHIQTTNTIANQELPGGFSKTGLYTCVHIDTTVNTNTLASAPEVETFQNHTYKSKQNEKEELREVNEQQNIKVLVENESRFDIDENRVNVNDHIKISSNNPLQNNSNNNKISLSSKFLSSLIKQTEKNTSTNEPVPLQRNSEMSNCPTNEKMKTNAVMTSEEYNANICIDSVLNESDRGDYNISDENGCDNKINDMKKYVACLEDGLADDDSWIEDENQLDEIEMVEERFETKEEEDEEKLTATPSDSDMDSSGEDNNYAIFDREEELRGYNRNAIDFTLHTIVEESCEESELENIDSTMPSKRSRNILNRLSASELEKYFFFDLGDGKILSSLDTRDDSASEISSECSDGGLDSLDNTDDHIKNESESDLASSRLEKYFLSGFMGFSGATEKRNESDESGSVGSDSEGHPSPSQRRKRLVRARGTPRSQNSSLDNLLMDSNEKLTVSPIPTAITTSPVNNSRDSGFVGSNDDLLKSEEIKKQPYVEPDNSKEFLQQNSETVTNVDLEIDIQEKSNISINNQQQQEFKASTSQGLVRKDSFNNWSSDEETNIMMVKMRQFFKSLIVATTNAQNYGSNTSKESTPISRRKKTPLQLAYFENELTRLMKTVPGINDKQVREIVEYLSSEDTWSDSYDSSDYTSSDLECAASKSRSSEISKQISDSCQQIINKFEIDEEGDRGDGGLIDDSHALNPETALVYQKLVASFSKMATGNTDIQSHNTGESEPTQNSDLNFDNKSPQILSKVMHHIGTRLVALMHEVSSDGTYSPIPPQRQHYHHKKAVKKATTSTEEDEDEPKFLDSSNKNQQANCISKIFNQREEIKNLSRSKSHDLLLDTSNRPQHHHSSSGVSDTAYEEYGVASDYERFSWRGSFESALLANGDSRTKLTILDKDNSSSASALLVAKRRSAGDLLFNQHTKLSEEQLNRVRSCGSIGGGNETLGDIGTNGSKPWVNLQEKNNSTRRSSVPDAIYESAMSDNDSDSNVQSRSTLPRNSLNSNNIISSTNSLPRLQISPLNSTPISKSQNSINFPTNSVKSARYRPPSGLTRSSAQTDGKKTTNALQNFIYSKHSSRKLGVPSEEAKSAPVNDPRANLAGNKIKSSVSSPIGSQGSASSDIWPPQSEEDIDRLVALHQNRNSLSSLGIRSDSMASVYSGAGEGRYGTVVVNGQVEFGMQYNYKFGSLDIHVIRCKDLAPVDIKRNRSDPYVKVYLLPDKSKSGKRKTKVKKHTLNPVFDELLRFQIPLSNLESRSLWLSVWHSDMFGRNDFLGEVTINLQGLIFDNPQAQLYQLQERSDVSTDEISDIRGDIVVGLKFIPPQTYVKCNNSSGTSTSIRKFGSIKSSSKQANTTSKGQLHVLVKEAKNLCPVKANGSCDAFCKSYLLPDRTKNSKQKTSVVKRCINPTWNYTFVYEDISLEELSERALELTIWDHDRLASNEFLGGVRFSLGSGKYNGRQVDWMDSTGRELSLWQNMLNRPNFWVEGALILRSSLDGIQTL